MIRKAGRTEKEGRCPFATRHDDTKVAARQVEILLFLLRDRDLYPAQILDQLAFLNDFPRRYCGFRGVDGVAVRGRDLKGTVRKVYADIFAQMSLKVFAFVW